MGEVLQTSETIKLYCEDYEKPELSDETLAHYGVLGMRWGVRKDRGKSNGSIKRSKNRKAKKQVKTYKDPKEALAAKDLKYMNEHKDLYSTSEINQVLSRVDTERRLSSMAKDYGESKTKRNIKKILGSKAFKVAATVGVGTLALAGSSYFLSKRNNLLYRRDLDAYNKIFKTLGPIAKHDPKKLATLPKKPVKPSTVSFLDEVIRIGGGAAQRAAKDIVPGAKYFFPKKK